MIKPDDPRVLASDILERSTCQVQVGAAIADVNGRIISWGWNSVGNGFGEHAEAAAIRRANRSRVRGGTIYIASKRERNGKVVPSKPCEDCQELINGYDIRAIWRDKDGRWVCE